MRKEIAALRTLMEERGIDVYIVPTCDFHGSEYINEYFSTRKFLSGFTGSAGTLVITKDDAKLWTDGRYFLQAGIQLDGSGIVNRQSYGRRSCSRRRPSFYLRL